MPLRQGAPLLERLADLAMVGPPHSCWLVDATANNNGYGRLSVGGRVRSAHRVAYEAVFGRIPEGMLVLHSCHVRTCINPLHLRLGTNAENAADMVAAGRQTRGAGHCSSKLSEAEAAALRVFELRPFVLAPMFGVTADAVGLIKHGKTWRHLDKPRLKRRSQRRECRSVDAYGGGCIDTQLAFDFQENASTDDPTSDETAA